MSNKIVKHSKRHQEPRGRKIAEADWDKHRDKILHLWLEDDSEGRTLDQIVEIMAKDHQFSATTAQYHNHILKKWSIRKNITKREWHKLYYEILLRTKEGRSTSFRFHNRLISAETQEREWARYGFSAENAAPGLSPLPDAFDFEGNNAATLVTATHSSGPSTIIPSSASNYNSIQPFSWGFTIDWEGVTQAVGAGEQIVRWWDPGHNRLSAMFYPQYQASTAVASMRGAPSLQYLISSVVNGIGSAATPDSVGVYVWLANLPRQQILGILRSLPQETSDVLCQRIRTAAAGAALVAEVKCMLELEHSLRQGRALTLDEMRCFFRKLPLEKEHGVAEVFVKHITLSFDDPDLVLAQFFQVARRMSYPMKRPLMWQILESGAMPILDCFLAVRESTPDLDTLLLLSLHDILYWVQAGILQSFLLAYDSAYTADVEWVLSQVRNWVFERQAIDRWTDIEASTVHSVLSKAFRTSLGRSSKRYTEIIYESCCLLGLQPTYSETDWQINQEVLLACHSGDLLAATIAATASRSQPPPPPSSTRVTAMPADLRIAILADDLSRFIALHRSHDRSPWMFVEEALDLALREGSDEVGAFIASRMDLGPIAIMEILSSGRLRAIDLVIATHSHLEKTLQDPNSKGEYRGLQDWLYHRELHTHCSDFPCNFYKRDSQSLQLFLRVLGYCALYRGDIELLDWLCKQGLALGGLRVEAEHHLYQVASVPSLQERHVRPAQSDLLSYLPSFLEISAGQQDLGMLQYLISASPAQRHSRALLQAVKAKAYNILDELLRYEVHNTVSLKRTQYGSAALRVAIRRHDHTLVSRLAEITDIHGIEYVEEDEGVLDWLDPLGEAILQDDCDAVEILLRHGGDPNAVVAFEGLQKYIPRSSANSVISRMTALLVAIDIGSRPMIELLLSYGATVNRGLDMGLLRTPLQRAAEIGDFDIVQYLIEKGATLDTVPAYGGGTALQLAAMSGHVGIAGLLVEKGADVNHPPAKGPGRTAFEAAAEWCRPDMMYLLVQHGAKLDLEVVEELEERYKTDDPKDVDLGIKYRWRTVRKTRSQYERAIEFADKREEYASKRIVQNLWDKSRGQQVHEVPVIEA